MIYNGLNRQAKVQILNTSKWEESPNDISKWRMTKEQHHTQTFYKVGVSYLWNSAGRSKEPTLRCPRIERCLADRLLRARWALSFAFSIAFPCMAGLSSNNSLSSTRFSMVPAILPAVFALLSSSSLTTVSTAVFAVSFRSCCTMNGIYIISTI